MNYGWEAVIWMVAGLYLMCIVFGALLRPLEMKEGLIEEGKKKNSHVIPTPSKCCGSSRDGLSSKYISPFSRKDLFYCGTCKTLMKANSTKEGTTSTWDEFRHLLFIVPR